MNRPSYWNELTEEEREEYTNYQPFTDEANGEDHIGEHLLDKIRPLNDRGLAHRLKQYGIKSCDVKINGVNLKGYTRPEGLL